MTPEEIFGTDLHTRFVGSDLASLGAGGAVASWPDATGHGHDAVQATTTKQPTAQQVTANGKTYWVARFDGVDDGLATASFPGGIVAQPDSIVVIHAAAATTTGMLLTDGTTVGARQTISGTSGKWTAYAGNGLNGAALDLLWHARVAIFNGASSSIRQDGGGPVSGDAGANSIAGLTLGNNYQMSAAVPYSGDIAEVIFVNAAITASQLVEIDSYAQDTYGITVADYQPSVARSVKTLIGGVLVTKPVKTLVNGVLV